MKVWIVSKDEGGAYRYCPIIKRVFANEEKADAYMEQQQYCFLYQTEEWEVEE